MERIELVEYGRDAEALLAGDGPFEVIAAFARSFYLRDGAGRICCVGTRAIGSGPLNALLAEPAAVPAVGTRATNAQIGRARAMPWRAPPLPPLRREGLRSRIAAVAAAGPRGLAAALPAVLGASWQPADPFLAAAIGPLRALRDWKAGEPPPALAELIGLGPGLTPAGDDALGGAAIALRATGRTEHADRLADWLSARAPGATSDIAWAHLKAALRGEGHLALHAALAAIVAGDAPDLVAIDAIGHSSGWDALAGALAVLSQP
jgi:hypothetical protein